VEPFYMTFPMQNLFLAEQEYEKDLERMRELYPKEVRQIAALVSDRCDELEYEGSRIYDENPDRMMMAREAQALYEKIRKESGWNAEENTESGRVMEENVFPDAFSLRPPLEWEQSAAVLEQEALEQAAPPPQQPMGPPQGPPQMPPPPQPPMQQPGECNDWLCSVVGILFADEVYKRRCRYRRCKRWW
jgi:hypothetical protein